MCVQISALGMAAIFWCAGAFFAQAQENNLSPQAKARDANNNNRIERNEAGGPLAANFDIMDCNKDNQLDGNEIRGFFTGAGCPKADKGKATAAKSAGQPGKPGGKRSPRGGNPPASVEVDAVIEENVSQTFPIIGRLVSRQVGTIASEVAGSVRELKADIGDRLKKNEVIATVDPSRLESERSRLMAIVEQRKANMATAQAELDKVMQEAKRVTDLKARSSAAFSRARYEDIEQDVAARRSALIERRAQLQEAEANLQTNRIDLNDTNIIAPFDGVITEKHIEVGTYLKVGDQIVTLLNDSNIEVEAEVPTDQIYGLRNGVGVKVILDDDTVHSARVRAVIPQENLRTRTRAVRFTPEFGKLKKALATDQSVTVNIPLEANVAVTVHKDAIIRRGRNA
ncbi:MAG: efflux RND transporter periplasmic adaptor subunit, partial [Methyloligellaceae bacterium]